ncbi:CASP-like protein PIMP1 [Ipomoea triloba]|uniref:CASP-like protein PIMP1 n=1 Tax=Ipomoea triloba TaxID=35885 RepID=UPI00125DF346|nr:CASP-like protein PIMP1 [Ipomoea triloba]
MATSPVAVLIVRILTLVFLLASLILITTNTVTLPDFGGVKIKLKFHNFTAYRYLAATLILGLAYTLLQTAFAISQACTGKRIGGERFSEFVFFGDKVVSYLLATGAAVSLAITQELKKQNNMMNKHKETVMNNTYVEDDMDKFANKASVAARLCLIGFLFAATSSVFSSYALPKRA